MKKRAKRATALANIVFRLPSKQITYGYVEVSGTPEEFGIHSVADADAIGITYAHYVNRYLEGEVEGVRQVTGAAELAPKKAPGKPVEGVSGVRQVRTVAEVMSDEDVDTEAEARAIIEKELGATVIDSTGELSDNGRSDDAPWSPAKAEAAGQAAVAKPKPWENSATPKVAKIEW